LKILKSKNSIFDFFLNFLKRELQAKNTEIQELTEKLEEAERIRVETENNQKELDQENKNLKLETDQLREMCIQKGSEVEEAKAANAANHKEEHPSFSIQDEIDDLKVKSFLEVTWEKIFFALIFNRNQ